MSSSARPGGGGGGRGGVGQSLFLFVPPRLLTVCFSSPWCDVLVPAPNLHDASVHTAVEQQSKTLREWCVVTQRALFWTSFSPAKHSPRFRGCSCRWCCFVFFFAALSPAKVRINMYIFFISLFFFCSIGHLFAPLLQGLIRSLLFCCFSVFFCLVIILRSIFLAFTALARGFGPRHSSGPASQHAPPASSRDTASPSPPPPPPPATPRAL